MYSYTVYCLIGKLLGNGATIVDSSSQNERSVEQISFDKTIIINKQTNKKKNSFEKRLKKSGVKTKRKFLFTPKSLKDLKQMSFPGI